MNNKELLNNIIAITASRSAIAHIKYTYEDVVEIAETYAKEILNRQAKATENNHEKD